MSEHLPAFAAALLVIVAAAGLVSLVIEAVRIERRADPSLWGDRS